MSKKGKPRETTKKDGFILEWFPRRGSLDVDVYQENSDGTKGKLVSELGYPKLSGTGPRDWEAEAVSIAKRELEKSKAK
jgi:hypothetical protein